MAVDHLHSSRTLELSNGYTSLMHKSPILVLCKGYLKAYIRVLNAWDEVRCDSSYVVLIEDAIINSIEVEDSRGFHSSSKWQNESREIL